MFLVLLVFLPWFWATPGRGKAAEAIAWPWGAGLSSLPETLRTRLARKLPWLSLLSFALAILALARPQLVEREIRTRTEGVELVVAIDLSTSMLAEPRNMPLPRKNRLAIAKEVLSGFLEHRPGDHIGLVAFAGRPYAASPLTSDHAWLRDVVSGLRAGIVEDGTALGDAIVSALRRLRGRNASSQAIILITDGRNNAGEIDPVVAAAAAKALGVRVHAIGVGSRGPAVVPVENPLGGVLFRDVELDLDEAELRDIASVTGGRYFRAEDREVLADVFRTIDRIERRSFEDTVHLSHRELYPVLLQLALVLAIVELVLRTTCLRRVP